MEMLIEQAEYYHGYTTVMFFVNWVLIYKYDKTKYTGLLHIKVVNRAGLFSIGPQYTEHNGGLCIFPALK